MMGANLLTKKSGVCGNCRLHFTGDGECPMCGTYWWGGTGFRVEWEPGGTEAFVRDAARLAEKAGLPPGSVQVLSLHPRDFFTRSDASVCACGHAADWHSHGGKGDCEHDADCDCPAFEPPRV